MTSPRVTGENALGRYFDSLVQKKERQYNRKYIGLYGVMLALGSLQFGKKC